MTDAEKLAEVTAQRDKYLQIAIDRGWLILDLQRQLMGASNRLMPTPVSLPTIFPAPQAVCGPIVQHGGIPIP